MTALISSIIAGLFLTLIIAIARLYARIKLLQKENKEQRLNDSIREEQLEIAANNNLGDPYDSMRNGEL